MCVGLRIVAFFLITTFAAGMAFASSGEDSLRKSQALRQEQIRNAEKQIETRPVRIIYAGFALDHTSTGFLHDMQSMSAVVKRMSAANVQLMSSNGASAADQQYPQATQTDFAETIANVSRLADKILAQEGNSPLIVLLLSSHGSPGHLVMSTVERPDWVSSAQLARILAPLEKHPTLVIISSCYAGSHDQALRSEKRMLLYSSAPNNTSMGCAVDSKNTWFIAALASSFKPGLSLRDWYSEAFMQIHVKEKAHYIQRRAEPFLRIGKSMLDYASQPLTQMLNTSATRTAGAGAKAMP